MKWKLFRRYWPFVTPVTSQRPVTRSWTNVWVNSEDAGDFRRHYIHHDITVMTAKIPNVVWSGTFVVFLLLLLLLLLEVLVMNPQLKNPAAPIIRMDSALLSQSWMSPFTWTAKNRICRFHTRLVYSDLSIVSPYIWSLVKKSTENLAKYCRVRFGVPLAYLTHWRWLSRIKSPGHTDIGLRTQPYWPAKTPTRRKSCNPL